MAARNLILTGFMGTGKTTVAREVSAQLGMQFVDMDEVIIERMGRSIPDIFGDFGEDAFRQLERSLCIELAQQSGLVVATGGGALVDAQNLRMLSATGLVICLDCAPAEIVNRIGADPNRPMLKGAEPANRVRQLLDQRREAYGRIAYHIDTTRQSPAGVVDRVIALYQTDPVCLPVISPSGDYAVHIMDNGLGQIGTFVRTANIRGRVMVVSDNTVWPLHGQRLTDGLAAERIDWVHLALPAGEQHKRLETVCRIYDAMLAEGIDRSGAVIALGGGVITDMAGFAAATYMRGVPLIQAPTTLLSMVDASVGGKVAVDLPQGKNLVGAFKQPALVVIDTVALETLPHQQLLAGLAEVLKAGIIADPELFGAFETGYEQHEIRWLIRRALEVKIAVVQEDPYEKGIRAVLNLGHTFAHALELLADYGMSHGLAVSRGTAAAARVSLAIGACTSETCQRIITALERTGLPTTVPFDPDAIVEAMGQDKKRVANQMRLVLVRDIGDVYVEKGITQEKLVELLGGLA